jgi:AcrR family transcriptional regulator
MHTQSLSQRLAAVRRDHILDAALRVFAARGFNRATIRDIAHAAGVADGTIYNYFDNKDALLFAILDRLNETERRERDLTRPAGVDPREFVRSYVRHRFEVFERVGFDAFQVLIAEVLVNPSLRARYLRDIIEPTFSSADVAVATWTPAEGSQPTPDARLQTRLQAALVLGCLVLRLCGEPLLRQRWTEVPDLIADMIFHSTGAGHANDSTS